MRKKLIDLLLSVPSAEVIFGKREGKRYTTAWHIANHLIANGVTVQEWIPVTERLPEEEGWYLVYTTPNREHKSINKAMFCKGYAWGNFEPYWRGAGGHWANVTHWMPLPEPPKGE